MTDQAVAELAGSDLSPNASRSTPSTPGAPLFALTFSYACQTEPSRRFRRRNLRQSPEIPHLMAGSVYRLAGAGGGSAEGVGGGVVVA